MLPKVRRWPEGKPPPSEEELARLLQGEDLEPVRRVLSAGGGGTPSGVIPRETLWLVRGSLAVEDEHGERVVARAGDRLDFPPGIHATLRCEGQDVVLLEARGTAGWT